MKCQECGALIPAGHLYCEACGRELQIVPDFEPELENSLNNALAGLMSEAKESSVTSDKTVNPSGKRTSRKWQGKGRPVFVIITAALLIAAAVSYVYFNSVDYLHAQALEAMNRGEYEAAAEWYQTLQSKQPEEIEWLLGEADSRIVSQDTQGAKDLLQRAVTDFPEDERAWRLLMGFYEQEKDYQNIQLLLTNCTHDSIKEEYGTYLTDPPTANFESGSYDQILEVTLSAAKNGNIHYTLDDSVPNRESDIFRSTLRLGNGIHRIKAVFINEYGLVSDPAIWEFEIRTQEPLAPAIYLDSGMYDRPQFISASTEEGCRIYYTTDGTVPTMGSHLYEDPIPLPLGASTFCFVAFSEAGVPGEEVFREYMLNMKTSLTTEEAEGLLVQKQIDRGILLDKNGALSDRYGVYRYFYDFPASVGDSNYFIFSEHYMENEINELTGSYYAVDVISGETRKVAVQPDGRYMLEII